MPYLWQEQPIQIEEKRHQGAESFSRSGKNTSRKSPELRTKS
ncbi:hypothetical protein HMPREF1990_00229 [Porphyromonas gingivalis W4087]|nr:hypothetical protein A343_2179 [Porphyromonas gingivalis JCVI SC001]ERJ69409.1 hypothetical protein HMPREF1553_00574 [Porphyromonas gingivalis F0568]ERJ91067.1 hypothetical protein HMPREF1990_00229 [Porphyromonas gingivalis W4087]